MWHEYTTRDLLITMCLHTAMVTISVLATLTVLDLLRRLGILIDDGASDDSNSNADVRQEDGSMVRYIAIADDPLMPHTLSVVEDKV